MLAAASSLHSGWVASGPQVEAFERELCMFLGLPAGHAVCVSSGTAALAVALHVLGAKGKRVAMPAYACSSLRHAVAFAHGTEELHDVAKNSPNIDLSSVNQSSPDLVVVPHMYGIPVDVRKIASGIRVIEDCAQAIGSTIGGAKTGTLADASIFSFYASKLMTSGGQGGAVVSKDKAFVDAVRDYCEFDCRRDSQHRFNFQMSDVLAAVGRVQLKRLPAFLSKRSDLFEEYRATGIPLLDVSPNEKDIRPVRFRAVTRTALPKAMISNLEEAHIRAIVPTEAWELLGKAEDFPCALELCKSTVSLPLYPTLTKKQVAFIAKQSRLS